MKTRVYKNEDVILYTVDCAKGEGWLFNPTTDPDYAPDKNLLEMPRCSVNKVITGSVKVLVNNANGTRDYIVDADSPLTETTPIGDTRFTAVDPDRTIAFCFSRHDKLPLKFAEAPMLEPGQSFTLHSPGYLTIGSGSIELAGNIYGVGTLLKVKNIGATITAVERSVLGYIGDPL